jgi:hypothetical protein
MRPEGQFHWRSMENPLSLLKEWENTNRKAGNTHLLYLHALTFLMMAIRL